jgi:excisionase family DNA binding protein
VTSETTGTVSVEVAARLLGVSRTTAYRLAADGQFPVPVLRVGRSLRVPAALLADALGLRVSDVTQQA